MKRDIPSLQGKRQLLYVTIYGKIEDMIKQNQFQTGEKLPGENELAEQLGVSRGTLRQALLLLREDGMIYNHQGKGNFITARKNMLSEGLERIYVQPHQYNLEEYDDISLTMEYTPSSNKMQEYLALDSSKLIMSFNISYKIKGDVAAHVMYFVTFERANTYSLNLDSDQELLDFINDYIAQNIKCSKTQFNLACARAAIAEKMRIPEGTPLMFFSEQLMLANGEIAVYAKSYLVPSFYEFRMMRG